MKKYITLMSLILLIGFYSCEDKFLDLESLTEPVDATFYSSEAELELALTGAYTAFRYLASYGVPQIVVMDNASSDIGVSRNNGDGFVDLGSGIHSSTTAGFRNTYTFFYRGIARTNLLLQNMERAIDVVSDERYNQIAAEALVIRAYCYMMLTESFGDVPFLDGVISSPSEALLPRENKSTIVDNILADLQTASQKLPVTWSSSETGRITKGFALGLRARIALYNERYDIAASSAKAVIDNESAAGYSLHPNYFELFQGVANSPEVMLSLPYKYGWSTSQFTLAQGSRNRPGCWSVMYPSQSLVDSYEATDGKPIDESTVYDPRYPFENRDPRLTSSIITPQSVWAGIIYESHPDSLSYRFADGSVGGFNKDNRANHWPASYCGYLWKKYTIEESQKVGQTWNEEDFTLMRYAEVLLTYVEAKIELGQVDVSVLNALNRIRARAYGVNVDDTGNYPAVTTTNVSDLRKVLRRERKVELANEGFRLFDIRRWRIAEKVMSPKIYGRMLDPVNSPAIPQIDDDCFVSYAGIGQHYLDLPDPRFVNGTRIFNPGRDYLSPIPQQEIDTYVGLGGSLTQNPGY